MPLQPFYSYGSTRFLWSEDASLPPGEAEKEYRLITDENLAALYPEILDSSPGSLVIPAREESKQLSQLGEWLDHFLATRTDRHTFLIGMGGGLVTDLTGFLASVYMRGLDFGYIPTSLLAMVDAALGGKTAMNHGAQKNLVGSFQWPKFIHFHLPFLSTLPRQEWANGFAEIIKYQLLFHPGGLQGLGEKGLDYFREHPPALRELILQCVADKMRCVEQDPLDRGIRQQLNLGHTVGHALETHLQLDHGQAVALGLVIACYISEKRRGLSTSLRESLEWTLERFGLPTRAAYNAEALVSIMTMDKKRQGGKVDFILLDQEAQVHIEPLTPPEMLNLLNEFLDRHPSPRTRRG